jgi:hypothetical protein
MACERRPRGAPARADRLRYDRAVTASRDQAAYTIDRATLEAEVARIIEFAEAAGIPFRVLGSIAVSIRCPAATALLAPSRRTYADIDMVAYRRGARELTELLVRLGYVDDREVYAASEGARSILFHADRHVHLDVFYDRLEFCHIIPLAGRLEIERPTIPLAELLLSKLQIVKLNDKDVVDTILLLLDHPLGQGDADTIDVGRIASLAADEWGLWRTLTMNLQKVAALGATYPQLADDQRVRVAAAVTTLKAAIDAIPKPFAWRMRDRVGDRRQWWTDVDEVR